MNKGGKKKNSIKSLCLFYFRIVEKSNDHKKKCAIEKLNQTTKRLNYA